MALHQVQNERHAIHGIFKRRIPEKNILRRKGAPVRKKGGHVTINLTFFWSKGKYHGRKATVKKRSLFDIQCDIMGGNVFQERGFKHGLL